MNITELSALAVKAIAERQINSTKCTILHCYKGKLQCSRIGLFDKGTTIIATLTERQCREGLSRPVWAAIESQLLILDKRGLLCQNQSKS